jgi:multisubunit Na+/H+ antiporter MnhC subunit
VLPGRLVYICFSHAWYVQHPTTYSSRLLCVVASLKTCAVTAVIVLTAIVAQLSDLALLLNMFTSGDQVAAYICSSIR